MKFDEEKQSFFKNTSTTNKVVSFSESRQTDY